LIPNSPVPLMWSMEKELSDSTKMHRDCMLLMNFFGVVGVALALLGTCGIAAYAAARQTHEIGVRMALGATGFDVLRLILGQGIRLTLVGVAVGSGGALFLTQALSSLLYNVSPTDPFTFVCVSLLLTASALLASYIPARRAAKTDPMAALRYE
jgi:putative ABC transport system permease protein